MVAAWLVESVPEGNDHPETDVGVASADDAEEEAGAYLD